MLVDPGSKCDELTDFRVKSEQSARRVNSSTIAAWKHGSGSGLRRSIVVNSHTKKLAHTRIVDGSNLSTFAY
jgi:hypothetical protein